MSRPGEWAVDLRVQRSPDSPEFVPGVTQCILAITLHDLHGFAHQPAGPGSDKLGVGDWPHGYVGGQTEPAGYAIAEVEQAVVIDERSEERRGGKEGRS